MLVKRFLTIFVTLALGASSIRAADLSVADTVVSPDATATVVVSGSITGESTYAVNILLELVPRGGNTGTVGFTPGPPPVDIVQLGDPWPPPLGGLFSRYDTLITHSTLLNGSLDDNGTLLAAPVTYPATHPVPPVGPLSGFPVIASADAAGVWDVRLTTPLFGDSYWVGVTTTLIHGVITICGDGVTDLPEECDDGGESPTCDADCTVVVCGDGTLNLIAGEFCDDGNNLNDDGCSADCVLEPGDCGGDTNADSAVDLIDYEALHYCLSGPGSPPNPAGGPLGFVECLWFFDCSADGDVDLDDVAAFQLAFTGPQ